MQKANLAEKCDVVLELIRKCVDENAHIGLNQDNYMARYSILIERYETSEQA